MLVIVFLCHLEQSSSAHWRTSPVRPSRTCSSYPPKSEVKERSQIILRKLKRKTIFKLIWSFWDLSMRLFPDKSWNRLSRDDIIYGYF